MEKLIITVATTGSSTSRKQTPYIAITPEEIAEEVYLAYKAGAAIAHIHVRDENGIATMNYAKFEKTVNLIREKCDIVINITSSGGNQPNGLPLPDEERIFPGVNLKAEMMSLDCGSTNFGEGLFINTPSFLRKLAAATRDNEIKPEIEVFDTAMVHNAIALRDQGLILSPMHFQCVLGVKGGMPANAKSLLYLTELMPEGSTWSAFGIGRYYMDIAAMAVSMGGHVRVGMEDNIYLSKGVLAKHNAEFIDKFVSLAALFNREIATPDDARRILGLKKKV